jgi:GNAT superfamily N-acetyltransferase
VSAPGDTRVHRLVDASEAERLAVARDMQATLDEVIGAQKAGDVHTFEEIVERVDWHLERAPDREADVFVAEQAGRKVGHVLVRREADEAGPFGLVATIHVDPSQRRAGVAGLLLDAAEAWMRERGLERARTWTDRGNAKLIALFEGRGYVASFDVPEWTVLTRTLPTED